MLNPPMLFVAFSLAVGLAVGGATPPSGPDIKVLSVSSSGKILIRMANPSSRGLRIWRDSNSWGAARWRAIRVRGARVDIWYQTPYQKFTRNFPVFDEIEPQRSIQTTLDLTQEDWISLTGPAFQSERGDTVVLLYDVPITVEALEKSVWCGVATVSITLK